VAGKAVRDGLFLSRFAPSDLPKVVVAAALAAVLLGLGFARILGWSGPLRVVLLSFAGGSLLHLPEFAMLQGAGEGVRAVVITIVYLHLVGFGAILLSGFWSIVNEFFDPREAKLRFGRIAGAGTPRRNRLRPAGRTRGGAAQCRLPVAPVCLISSLQPSLARNDFFSCNVALGEPKQPPSFQQTPRRHTNSSLSLPSRVPPVSPQCFPNNKREPRAPRKTVVGNHVFQGAHSWELAESRQ
jgi:hypothetical protein